MSTEYSGAKSASSETNPLRLSNAFHMAVGLFNLLAGGGIAFLLTRETQDHVGLGFIPALSIAATLLVLGLFQIAQAWRDEKFRFHPDDIGKFAVPAKFGGNEKPNTAAYLVDVLNNGVKPEKTPDNALLKKLYNGLPRLELAPQIIRWHAETQALRMARLAVAALGFLLAWVFAKPQVFAWMAPLYLLLAIRPLSVLRNISRGGAGDQQMEPTKSPQPYGAVAILLFSIFGPILVGLLPPDTLPPAPYSASTIVVPTVVALVALMAASFLFLLSLKAQTRDLTTSGVGQQLRKDLNLPNLSSGLIDSLENQLPFPREVISRNPSWQKDGDFGGHLLAEAEPKINAAGSLGNLPSALRAAMDDQEQRPLAALGLLGVATGILATVLAFAYARSGGATVGLTALALFSASQFALLASRGLWNRVDFTSTLYYIHYKGSYRQAQRVAGNTLTGTGTLTENATRIEHVDVWVSVARLESVAFQRTGKRYIQSVDLKPQECAEQFSRIEDFHQNVMQRKTQAYQEEGLVRQLVQGPQGESGPGLAGLLASQVSPPAEPPPQA